MRKQIDVILNGKGGVGKSFFATNFVQFLKDRGIAHHAIDSDNENSTLKRFHREADFINIEDEQGIDAIFPGLEKAALVVIDCRAASTDIFLEYFAEVKVFDILRAMDAGLTVISPVNHEADSVEQVKIVADALGNRCKYVVVKNQAHSEHFAIYEKSKTRSRLIDELSARELVMPRLYDWLVTGLNQTNLTITPALQHTDFSLVNRQRLKNWQEKFYAEIERARDALLPAVETAPNP